MLCSAVFSSVQQCSAAADLPQSDEAGAAGHDQEEEQHLPEEPQEEPGRHQQERQDPVQRQQQAGAEIQEEPLPERDDEQERRLRELIQQESDKLERYCQKLDLVRQQEGLNDTYDLAVPPCIHVCLSTSLCLPLSLDFSRIRSVREENYALFECHLPRKLTNVGILPSELFIYIDRPYAGWLRTFLATCLPA